MQDWLGSLQAFGQKQIQIHAGDLLASKLGISQPATRLVGPHSARIEHMMGLVFGVPDPGPYNILLKDPQAPIDWVAMAAKCRSLVMDVAVIADANLSSHEDVVRSAIESDAPDSVYAALKYVPVGLACIYGPGMIDMRQMYGGVVRPNESGPFVGAYSVEVPVMEPEKDVDFNNSIVLLGGSGVDIPEEQCGKAARRVGSMIMRGRKRYVRFLSGSAVCDAFNVWKEGAVERQVES